MVHAGAPGSHQVPDVIPHIPGQPGRESEWGREGPVAWRVSLACSEPPFAHWEQRGDPCPSQVPEGRECETQASELTVTLQT